VSPARVKAEVLRALLGYYELRDLILSAFAPAPHAEVVRCSEVAGFVAERLDVENSPLFRRRVRHAAKLAGWVRVVWRCTAGWRAGESLLRLCTGLRPAERDVDLRSVLLRGAGADLGRGALVALVLSAVRRIRASRRCVRRNHSDCRRRR
jgi:hypothetical protein